MIMKKIDRFVPDLFEIDGVFHMYEFRKFFEFGKSSFVDKDGARKDDIFEIASNPDNASGQDLTAFIDMKYSLLN